MITCADCDVDIAPLLGLRRQDVLVLQTPGPYVTEAHVALLERAAAKHRLSLVLLLTHQHCDLLHADQDRDDVLSRRRDRLAAFAKAQQLSIADALLRREREQLLAASETLRELRHRDRLRFVLGQLDETTGRIRWRTRRAHTLPIAPVK